MSLKNGIVYFVTETQSANVHLALNFARWLDVDSDVAEVMSPGHEGVFDEMRDLVPASDAHIP